MAIKALAISVSLFLAAAMTEAESTPVAPAEPLDRGFALYRLPGRSGRSCFSCHEEQFSGTSAPLLSRSHLAEQLGEAAEDDFEAIRQYVGALHKAASQATTEKGEEFVRSMRSLGYVNFQAPSTLSTLPSWYEINAFELFQNATGSAQLQVDDRSPTGQVLVFRQSEFSGVVLPAFRILPGTYSVSVQTAASSSQTPFRLLLAAKDKVRRDMPLRALDAQGSAVHEFTIERSTPAILSITVDAEQVRITRLVIRKI